MQKYKTFDWILNTRSRMKWKKKMFLFFASNDDRRRQKYTIFVFRLNISIDSNFNNKKVILIQSKLNKFVEREKKI